MKTEKGLLCILLTEDSRKRLLDKASPIYPVVYADHVTLIYPAYLSPEIQQIIGKSQIIKLRGNAYNEKIQAAVVELTDLQSQNKFPHITISALEGVSPVESNSMLGCEHKLLPITGEALLEGTVVFKKI